METETIVQETTGEATEKKDAGGSAGEQVASQGTQGQEANAGGEQSSTESGREEGTERRPKFKSKNETIYELKQKLRERDEYWGSEVGTLKQQIAEIQKKYGGSQERKPSRTFYEAPEDVTREIYREEAQTLKEEILQELREFRDQDRESMSREQEASEAAKFIRQQEGLTKEDVLELSAIIREEPIMQRLTPMERAEYALYIYGKNRGVTDNTALKNKAATVNGSGANPAGPKVWTESEMASELNKLGNPKNWTNEIRQKARQLEQEFMSAYKTGRVKK